MIIPDGWTFDADLWFWRNRKEGDPDIRDQPAIGFTTASHVYVRTAELARAYDARGRKAINSEGLK